MRLRKWLILGAVAALIFVLGFFGWMRFFDLAGKDMSVLGLLEATLGLFRWKTFFPSFAKILNLADYEIPLILDIARITAPWITLFAFIALVFSVVRSFATSLKVRLFYRDHVVIFGCEETCKYLLSCVKADYPSSKLVLLKNSSTPGYVCNTYEENPVIVGNLEETDILNISGINRAAHIILATNDDSINMRLLKNIEQFLLRKSKRSSIEIWLQIEDFKSYETFKGYKGEDPSIGIDVHVFSVFQRMAAQTVDSFSPDQFIETAGKEQIEIALFGLEALGQWIVLEAAQMYHFNNMKKLRVTVIDCDVDEKIRDLLRICPLLNRVIDIQPIDLLAFLEMDAPNLLSNVSLCFITWPKVQEIDFISRKLRQIFFKSEENLEIPKIVLVDVSSYQGSEIMKESLDTLKAIGISCSCPTGISIKNEEECDDLAMQIHNVYSRLPQKELEVEWSRMTDYFKDENRYAARHLSMKLRSLGLEAVSTDDPRDPADFKAILPENEQTLAQVEHNRWLARKLINGYVHGKKLDRKLRDQLKIHVDIRPWEELSEKDREKDLVVLRNIDNVFKEVGKKIVPLKF